MAMHFLGPTVDIHGGGADLIFPHHESEIAQSECATDIHPFVRVWMHTAMVRYQGEKMSKSLGNMVFVRDALKQYDADAIRLYLLNHHYRTPWEYEDDGPATFLPLVQQATDSIVAAQLAATRRSMPPPPSPISTARWRMTSIPRRQSPPSARW